MFDNQYSEYKNLFEDFLKDSLQKEESSFSEYFSKQLGEYDILKNAFDLRIQLTENYSQKVKTFFEATKYSLGGEGKRFRPVLALATANALGKNPDDVLPFALCMEMIHSYSLIHDDLPCMDNDDLRRGAPTSHRVYGEATALLAGDALLTDAFSKLFALKCTPATLKKVFALVVECAGTKGMIGGQYFDMESQKTKVDLESLVQMEINKTGALIYASVMGSAILCEASYEQSENLKNFSRLLGLSFQIADDILDQNKNELGNFVSIAGVEKSKKILAQLADHMHGYLESLQRPDFLLQLAAYNTKRTK